jgi:hypothetical protein
MIIPPTTRNIQRNAKDVQNFEPDKRGGHQNNENVECCLDGGPLSLCQCLLCCQRQKDRTAHHRINDGQNGYNGLHYMVKVCHSKKSQQSSQSLSDRL